MLFMGEDGRVGHCGEEEIRGGGGGSFPKTVFTNERVKRLDLGGFPRAAGWFT